MKWALATGPTFSNFQNNLAIYKICMNAVNKYWEADNDAPHQQNLFGSVDLKSEKSEDTLIASYWPYQEGWEWRIYIFNNTPDMQEYGTCRTEEEARQAINYFIALT
jgi:hypothetical protein